MHEGFPVPFGYSFKISRNLHHLTFIIFISKIFPATSVPFMYPGNRFFSEGVLGKPFLLEFVAEAAWVNLEPCSLLSSVRNSLCKGPDRMLKRCTSLSNDEQNKQANTEFWLMAFSGQQLPPLHITTITSWIIFPSEYSSIPMIFHLDSIEMLGNFLKMPYFII